MHSWLANWLFLPNLEWKLFGKVWIQAGIIAKNANIKKLSCRFKKVSIFNAGFIWMPAMKFYLISVLLCWAFWKANLIQTERNFSFHSIWLSKKQPISLFNKAKVKADLLLFFRIIELNTTNCLLQFQKGCFLPNIQMKFRNWIEFECRN